MIDSEFDDEFDGDFNESEDKFEDRLTMRIFRTFGTRANIDARDLLELSFRDLLQDKLNLWGRA